jgi:hypothetical protein
MLLNTQVASEFAVLVISEANVYAYEPVLYGHSGDARMNRHQQVLIEYSYEIPLYNLTKRELKD